MISKILNILLFVVIVGFVGNYVYRLPKFSRGNVVPELHLTTIDGKVIDLDSITNKYILLHFWGSWCPTCRRKNVELVKLYKTYLEEIDIKSDQFEIISIAFEKNDKAHQFALEKDGIFWPTQVVAQGSFDSEIAKTYGVKQIPTMYLLDKNKKVVLTNPNINELKKFLFGLKPMEKPGQFDQ